MKARRLKCAIIVLLATLLCIVSCVPQTDCGYPLLTLKDLYYYDNFVKLKIDNIFEDTYHNPNHVEVIFMECTVVHDVSGFATSGEALKIPISLQLIEDKKHYDIDADSFRALLYEYDYIYANFNLVVEPAVPTEFTNSETGDTVAYLPYVKELIPFAILPIVDGLLDINSLYSFLKGQDPALTDWLNPFYDIYSEAFRQGMTEDEVTEQIKKILAM